ncbi:MAG: hypothetical protein R6W83_06565 [Cryobacterium sp.]
MTARCVLMLLALHRGGNPTELLFSGSLALVSAFVVFNKVGSPQYMLWIVPVVVVGITHGWARWRTPAYLMLVISVLTTLVFPVFYLPLVAGNLPALLLLTARNALLVVLFGGALLHLIALARRHAPARAGTERTEPERSGTDAAARPA